MIATSQAEITADALADRAECVMLRKGPHLLTAIRMLDDVLGRIQVHQQKKTSMLRNLLVARVSRRLPDTAGPCLS